MQSETFKVKSVELNLELTCRLLKLPRAVFIWVGLDDTLGEHSTLKLVANRPWDP